MILAPRARANGAARGPRIAPLLSTLGVFLALTLPVLASGGVDPWCQMFLHLLLLWLTLRATLQSVFFPLSESSRDNSWRSAWLIALTFLLIATLRSGAPYRSEAALWNWLDALLLIVLVSRMVPEERRAISASMIVSGVLLAGWALVESHLGQRLPQTTLLNPNILAGYLLIPLTLAGAQWKELDRTGRLASRASFFVIGLGLLATHSTAAIVSALIGGSFSWVRKKKHLRGIDAAVTLGLLSVALGISLWKLHSKWDWHRWLWWKACLVMMRDRPWWGQGPGTFDIAFPHLGGMDLYSLYAHSTWMQWGAENGLFAMGTLVFIVFSSIYRTHDGVWAGGLLAVALHNTVDYSLTIPAVAMSFWCLWALAITPVSEITTTRAPSPAWQRLAVSLTCLSLTMIAFSRFSADRSVSRALYALTVGNLAEARQLAEQAMQRQEKMSEAYLLLARLSVLRAAGSTAPAAEIQEALGWQRCAIEREPAANAYWIDAMHLAQTLGLRGSSDELRQTLLQTYPYLRHDKRFSSS
jgi:O-antigen ligase